MKQLAMACSCGYLAVPTCTSSILCSVLIHECNFVIAEEEGVGGGGGQAGLQEVRGDSRWLHHSPSLLRHFSPDCNFLPDERLEEELKNWVGNLFGMRFSHRRKVSRVNRWHMSLGGFLEWDSKIK